MVGTKQIVDFVLFVTKLVVTNDKVGRTTLEALAQLDDRPGSEKWGEELRLSKEGPTQKALRRFVQLMFQMQITRTVDHYLAYVADLLSAIFLARPETLRSTESVKVDFVLRHETMEDLMQALAERRVEKLAYSGLRDLSDSLANRPELSLFSCEEDLLHAARIVEDRNLIVHNRGVVNNMYRRKVPSSHREVGQPLSLEYDNVIADIAFLKQCVLTTDSLAVRKWQIPQISLPRMT